MAITDLTGTKWLLNETITKAPAGWDLDGMLGPEDLYYINFISDSVVYDIFVLCVMVIQVVQLHTVKME